MDRRWLTIDISPAEYAGLIGHSEGYVRKYVMKDNEAQLIRIRVPVSSVMEDIYDIRDVKEADRKD